jgi:CheY-like chemotaxis protein
MFLIALTGYGQAAERERGREAGFDEHLVKPVNVEEFLRLLAALRGNQPAAAAAS